MKINKSILLISIILLLYISCINACSKKVYISNKNSTVELSSNDIPNESINNENELVHSVDTSEIQLCGNTSSGNFTCPNGCCTRDSQCVEKTTETWDQCLIENGCQSEFGYCFNVEQLTNECEKELEEHKECFRDNYLKEGVAFTEYLKSYCFQFYTEKCHSFYTRLSSNQSICSLAKKYKSFGDIDSFDENEYREIDTMCYSTVDYSCRLLFNNHEKCNVDTYLDDKGNNNDPTQITEGCIHFESDECQAFYHQSNETRTICTSFIPEYKESIPDLNELALLDQKSKNTCQETLNHAIEDCEYQLKAYEYEECLLDIASMMKEIDEDDQDEFLIEKCSIFRSRKCKDLYSIFEIKFPICAYAQKTLSYPIYDTIISNINLNYQVCNYELTFSNRTKEKILSGCANQLEIYDECLLEYTSEFTDDEISQQCTLYKSEKCQPFYNLYEYLEDTPYCLLIPHYDYISDLNNIDIIKKRESYYKDRIIYDKLCYREKETNIEQCELERKSVEFCLLDEPSLEDEEEFRKQCTNFKNTFCQIVYTNHYLYLSSCYAAGRDQPQLLDKILHPSDGQWNYFNEHCPSDIPINNTFDFNFNDSMFNFGDENDNPSSSPGFGFGFGFDNDDSYSSSGNENGNDGFEFGFGSGDGFGFGNDDSYSFSGNGNDEFEFDDNDDFSSSFGFDFDDEFGFGNDFLSDDNSN